MTIFGERDLWAIEIEPLSGAPAEPDPGAAATWCSIRIWAAGKNLAAHTYKSSSRTSESLQWPAAYLARWFVRSWPGFWERAGWPLPGARLNAEAACRQLDLHLAEAGIDADDDLIDSRDRFVTSHSLLAAAAGGVMPYVYLMREGSTVYVSWGKPTDRRGDLERQPESDSDIVFHVPQGRARVSTDVFLQSVSGFLRWCREAVAGKDTELDGEISQWLDRITRPEAAEAILKGYVHPWGARTPNGSLNGLFTSLGLPSSWPSPGARLNPATFPVAVMFRALTPVVTEGDAIALLGRLRSYPADRVASQRLDELRSLLVLPSMELPHEQGYSLAEQLRSAMNNRDAYFDIEAYLEDIGIAIKEDDLMDAWIDGATMWSSEHGPVIVVNRAAKKTSAWAKRMTLAHELCHLLVDRQSAAELMVASTPWAPPEIEKRANAFAAELLLPKAGILRLVRDSIRARWVGEEARESLMEEFKVGATVCGHQLKNRLQIE